MPLSEWNDATRMTRAQLADRIAQMEATAHRNSTTGAPADRHRPMEDRRRREKIALYQEELHRRELADADQAAADARDNPECECYCSGDTADATDCTLHNPRHRATTEETMNYDQATQAATHEARRAADHDANSQQEERRQRAHELDRTHNDDDAGRNLPAFTLHKPTPVIPAPPSPRLAVPCPQCHAAIGEPCHNYKGQRCHPHGARKLPDQAAADARDAEAAAEAASQARAQTVASAEAQTRAELDATLERLIGLHSLPTVIDAAWDAAHRTFEAAKATQEHRQ